jgi:hypothetical protein
MQFVSDLINHENKQFCSFEQIQEKLETNNFLMFYRLIARIPFIITKYSDQSVISISNNSSHFKNLSVGFWTILSIRLLYINLAFLLDTIFFTKVSVVSIQTIFC